MERSVTEDSAPGKNFVNVAEFAAIRSIFEGWPSISYTTPHSSGMTRE